MALYITLLHAAFAAELAAVTPIVLLLLAVGLVTAILQAALQIEDATFSLLPKSFAMIFIGLFGGFGAMAVFERFAVYFIGHAAILVHQSWS
jgi:flagellar biosynthetic protein FliQ